MAAPNLKPDPSERTSKSPTLSPMMTLVIMAGLAELGYATLNISQVPVYLRDQLSYSESEVTAIGAIFLLAEGILRAPMGLLSDRFGRKRLMMLAPMLTLVTSLLSLVIHDKYGFMLLRALDGLGAAMLWPTAFAAVADSVDKKNRAQAMSFLNLTYMVGVASGPFVGGAANDFFNDQQAAYYVISALFLTTTLVVYRWFPADRPEQHAHDEDDPGNLSKIWSAIKLAPGFMLLSLTVFLGIGLVMLLIKLFAMDEYGFSESKFGALLLVPAVMMGLASVPLGRLADRMGRPTAIHMGLLASGLCLWIIASQHHLAVMAIAGGITAIGFLLAFPAWMAEVSEVDPSRRGAILGAVTMAQGIGSGIGAMVSGYLYQHVSIDFFGVAEFASRRTPFFGCALMITLSALISFWVVKRRPHHE